MNVIRPNCRVQFQPRDMEFLLSILGRDEPSEQEALSELLADDAVLDDLLDHDDLFHRLLEDHHCLNISSRFYFYILVRHTLKETGLDDREVADYVAELLAEFIETGRFRCRMPGMDQPADYIFEMLEALSGTEERNRFVIRAHVGNHSLFLSGLFQRHIQRRAERRGAPRLSYYEGMGSANFKIARDHKLAREYDLERVYDLLASQFHAARLALNDMVDRFAFLHDPDRSSTFVAPPTPSSN
ncbi:MAG: hypothetical protein AAF492_17240 [Verrucomicrobiota bacterium]